MTGERVSLTGHWTLWPVAALRGAGMPFALLDRFAMPDVLRQPVGERRNAQIRALSTQAAAAVVLDEIVREALVWQNPSAVDTWLGDYATRLAGGEPAPLANRAYREGVIARYAQRYCAKNESIGFFGPVAWARFAEHATGLARSGGGGIRRRTAYLEVWAVAALADAWSRDERVARLLPVRLDAATTFADGTLWRPRRPPVECAPLTTAVLSAVDGHRCADEIVAAVPGARAELDRLHEMGVLRTGFLVPHHDRPEDGLRRQVADLPDEAVRDELSQRLDDIVAARDAAATAVGPAAVRIALDDLSASFVKAGCAEAAVARQVAHGRTAAYLDCRRDVDVTIGGDLVDALRAPLGVLLDSAHWLAVNVADAVSTGLLERYRWLRSRRSVVTLSDLQFAGGDVLSATGPCAVDVLADYRERWAEIIPRDATDEIRLSTSDVRPLADALFPADGPIWAAARQHSPDLMLGRGPDGRPRWVLGELHVALNTVESRLFRTQCDDPDELVELTAQDMGDDRIVPVYPRDAVEATARTYPPTALDPPGRYRYWSYGSDDGHHTGVAVVPGTAITVHERDGVLVGDAGTWSAPVLELFGDFLTAIAVNLCQPRAAAPHLRRVLLDDVVICRESWSVPLADVPMPGRGNTDRGHQRVRDWAAGLGVPRHVFVRTPAHRKPIYVDFDAPLLVGNLLRAVRRALTEPGAGSTVDIVEMLPRPDELWLTDAAGRRCTAELRCVAVNGEVRNT